MFCLPHAFSLESNEHLYWHTYHEALISPRVDIDSSKYKFCFFSLSLALKIQKKKN